MISINVYLLDYIILKKFSIFYIDIGALKVYSEIQTNQTVKPLNTLWIIDQNQGNNWFIARIPTDYTDNFRIIFEGFLSYIILQ